MKTESLSKTPEFREGRTVRVYSGTCFTRVRLLPTDKTVHCSRRVSLRCGRCNRTYCEECYWEHKPLCDLLPATDMAAAEREHRTAPR